MPVACEHSACFHSLCIVECAMLNLLVMAATWRSPSSTDYFSNLFWVGFSPLFMVVTFKQTTIKHSMFMQKIPFLCTERACVFFSVLQFAL